MKRSRVSAETLLDYKRHQEQKQNDITYAKALTPDSLIQADGPLLTPFGYSFCGRAQ